MCVCVFCVKIQQLTRKRERYGTGKEGGIGNAEGERNKHPFRTSEFVDKMYARARASVHVSVLFFENVYSLYNTRTLAQTADRNRVLTLRCKTNQQ